MDSFEFRGQNVKEANAGLKSKTFIVQNRVTPSAEVSPSTC